MLDIVVNKNDIIKPLTKVQGIVDKKNIMSIINNVFIYTSDDRLFIEATDLEISYRGSIPCRISDQGAITVNATKLYEIIKEFPSDDLHLIEDENNWVEISLSDQLLFKIAGLQPDDYPRFRHINMENSITVLSNKLKTMVNKVIFSSSNEDQKFALSGIFMETVKDNDNEPCKLRMVTSDGHRLTLKGTVIEDKIGFSINPGVVLPKKGANEIRKFLSDEENILFGIDENFCYLKSEKDQLVIRLVDGKFPDYKLIIPENRDRFFIFQKNIIYNALKRISIFYSDTEFKGVKAAVGKNVLELESLNKEIGEAREILPIEYEKEPFEFAFNAKYLIDALSVMESDKIRVTVNDADSPCLVEGEDDSDFLALIMPMTILDDE